ncbi:TfoX/Sxy family DNA transformation protein [Planctopirus limnophila]|uniref:TfoX/Sxy family DNA transformation protein n=1 Tax=Planctopirus limnophila TaxID=120 RepID=UPI0009D64E35
MDELRRLGSVVCFLAVRKAGRPPTLNLLWAIEGAITDMPWTTLSQVRKASLLSELHRMTQVEAIECFFEVTLFTTMKVRGRSGDYCE